MRIALGMDMSFARRRKAPPTSDTPDLKVLLAEMSARQGSSRTALIHARADAPAVEIVNDPLIAIFAPDGPSAAATHQFSDKITNPVIPRQLI
jgi:hypothetical protein